MDRITEFRKALTVPMAELDIASLVQSLSRNPEEFPDMYRLTSDADITASWRALWVCEKLSEIYPEWFASLQDELTERLLVCQHDGSKRLLLSILFNLPVAEPISVSLLNFCLDAMLSPDESIAVQALCIKIAYRLCIKEPELLHELRILLESSNMEFVSKAVNSTIRNTLKRINQTSKRKK